MTQDQYWSHASWVTNDKMFLKNFWRSVQKQRQKEKREENTKRMKIATLSELHANAKKIR